MLQSAESLLQVDYVSLLSEYLTYPDLKPLSQPVQMIGIVPYMKHEFKYFNELPSL